MQRCEALLALGVGMGLLLGATQPAPANALTVRASAVSPTSSAAHASVMWSEMPRAEAGKGGNLPGTGNPPTYWDTIKARIAHGFHRSVSSLTKLWAPRHWPKGKGNPPLTTTIYDLAVQEGLSRQQLRTLEIGAIQAGWNAVVRRHAVTKRQASHEMGIIRAWNAGNLDGYVMYVFGQK